MKLSIKITDIFRPCNECAKCVECPHYNGDEENFDNDEPLKERLYNLFEFGEDCFNDGYEENYEYEGDQF